MMHLRLQALLKILMLVAVCMMGTGCLTCYNLSRVGSNSDTIVVTTEPAGAEVYNERGKLMGKTPCSIYVDLKNMNRLETVAIYKDGFYYGHLQISEIHEAGNEDTRLMFACFDAITVIPFLLDVIFILPVNAITKARFDSYDYRLVYKNRTISLDKIKSGSPEEGCWRVISPYADLYGEIKKEYIFCGWEQDGTYLYRTPEQERARRQAETERQQAIANAVVSGANQFSQQMQQISQQQYQPPPSPTPRPTPAVPAQTNTQRTVRPAPKPYQREIRPPSFNIGTNPDGSMKVSDQEWRDRKK